MFQLWEVGHFIADCPKPKKDERRPTEKDTRSHDKHKRSKDDRKSFKKKKHQKVLVAEDSNTN